MWKWAGILGILWGLFCRPFMVKTWSSLLAIYPDYVFSDTFIPEPSFQIINCQSAFWFKLLSCVYYLNEIVRLGINITSLATGKYNLCTFMHFEAFSLNFLHSSVIIEVRGQCECFYLLAHAGLFYHLLTLPIGRRSITEHTPFMNALLRKHHQLH